jgi:hypothetical protein
MTVRCQRCSWTEGLVDRKTDHIEITYQDNSDPVALVGKGDGKNFVVQFLINNEQSNNEEILEVVSSELDCYLVELEERDHWQYAKYHCMTSSNLYSSLHWHYCKNQDIDAKNRQKFKLVLF